MLCREARGRLFHPLAAEPGDPGVAAHVAGCDRCAAIAARLRRAQTALRLRTEDHVPDPAFAARVRARLPSTPDVLAWAALRVLPVALALALCCILYGATSGPGLSEALVRPDDPQLLTYVALSPEAAR